MAGPTAADTVGDVQMDDSSTCAARVPEGTKAWGSKDYFWRKKDLTIEFMPSVSQELRDRIKSAADEWLKSAGVNFLWAGYGGQPADFADSDIRVACLDNEGHWSKLGRSAERVPEFVHTMNLHFRQKHPEDDLRRVVLHEFGHALGLWHEHQRTDDNPIKWDKPYVRAYYAKPPNEWKPEVVDEQIFATYDVGKKQFIGTDRFDVESIMLYPILKHFTTDGLVRDWNKVLSPGDKSLIALIYPRS